LITASRLLARRVSIRAARRYAADEGRCPSRSPEYLKQDDFGFRIGGTVQPGAAMTVQGDEPGRSRSGFSAFVSAVRERLKQVVCMFFSVNGPAFHARHLDLVRFVLNKESRDFPDDVRIYAFYTFSNRMRMAGVSGVVTGLSSSRSRTHVFSEITFPPFGLVLTFDGIPPTEAGFCEISGFSRFNYMDWRDGITMKLPLMPIYTGFPGDYRTRDKTLADFQENRARAAQSHRGRPEVR
jgi:hypothetical protein